AADIHIDDHRNFFGLYGYGEWSPAPAWRLEAGLRLNSTKESRSTSTLDFESGDLEAGADDHDTTRLTGSVGPALPAWDKGDARTRVFANYKNTFKPAATDFGPDSSPEILEPETAQSGELGVRGWFLEGAVSFDVSSFLMDFNNLVISQQVDGLPTLANAG